MLSATIRSTPALRAAAIRLRVPSRRRRPVLASLLLEAAHVDVLGQIGERVHDWSARASATARGEAFAS